LERPDVVDLLFLKAFAVVAVSIVGRGAESLNMERSDITYEMVPLAGGGFREEFQAVIEPAKMDEARTTDPVYAIISDPTFVKSLKEYLAVYDASPPPTGTAKPCTRLWRKMMAKPDGTRFLIHQPLGKSKCSAVGKRLAELLGLENPDRYTGHWARRTGISLLAECKFDGYRWINVF